MKDQMKTSASVAIKGFDGSSLEDVMSIRWMYLLFFFIDTSTTDIYTLSLHDALPISSSTRDSGRSVEAAIAIWPGSTQEMITLGSLPTRYRRPPYRRAPALATSCSDRSMKWVIRSEEHTSELQSQSNLVCRLLLEKKK